MGWIGFVLLMYPFTMLFAVMIFVVKLDNFVFMCVLSNLRSQGLSGASYVLILGFVVLARYATGLI